MAEGPAVGAIGPEDGPPAKCPRGDLWIGQHGKSRVQHHLSETSDVVGALRHVQEAHGLPAGPQCDPALALLRLLGADRRQLCGEFSEFLLQKLLVLIPTLGRPKLLTLLPLVFPHARHPFACDVLAAIGTAPDHLAQLPPGYLRALGADDAAFPRLPLPLRRQIWEADPLRWKKDVMRWLKTYTADASARASTALAEVATVGRTAAWRCGAGAVAACAQAIGTVAFLFTETARMLRELWLRYHHAEAGQFLHQLLLDLGPVAVVVDPRLHRLAALVDALVTQGLPEGGGPKELQGAAAALRGDPALSPMAALVLGHPLAAAALAHAALAQARTAEGGAASNTIVRLMGWGSPAGATDPAAGAALARPVAAAGLCAVLMSAEALSSFSLEPVSTLSGAPAADAHPLAALSRTNAVAQTLVLVRGLQLVRGGGPAHGLGNLCDAVAEFGVDRLSLEDAWLEAVGRLALAPPLRVDVIETLLRRLFGRLRHVEPAAHAAAGLVRALGDAMAPADLELLMNRCGLDLPWLMDETDALSTTSQSADDN